MTGHHPSDSEANSLSQRVPLTPWMTASGMDWSALTAGLSPEILPKGGILYQQGSPSDEMFLIVEGRVRLECCHSNGKNRAIYIVSNGVTIGEAGAMFGEPTIFKRWPSAGVPSTGYPLPCSAVVRKPLRPWPFRSFKLPPERGRF